MSSPLPTTACAIVDELRTLEQLKCAAEARQARLAVALDRIRAGDGAAAVHSEVALARRISPHRGRQTRSLARILDRELPHTRAAFEAGQISEWRATIIARETACLDATHRAYVDEAVAADAAELAGRGDRETSVLIRQLAARLDAAAVARRRRRAESERRVSIRPAPDSMVYLTALLPVAAGVGVYAALRAAAETAVGTGVARGVGQAMADELVRRTTGAPGAAGEVPVIPVALRLAMPVDALFDHTDDPAFLTGHGPLPAEAARALVADNLAVGAKVWLKRLFVRPESGELVAMESHSRSFPRALGEFLELRDRWCRTPWCDAPIRHHDHVRSHAVGGVTTDANGQGLCAGCNQAKEADGWLSRGSPGPRHAVSITTPTGHRYRSRAPAA